MKVTLTTLLRVMLYASLAVMVTYYVTAEQSALLMVRGYEEGFDVTLGPPIYGQLFLLVTFTLLIVNVIQLWKVRKSKTIRLEDYILPEYDVSDERARDITGRAVKYAFGAILLYSFFALGSYMYIPQYFLDYMWYPFMITASIPIVGLIVYYTSYKVLLAR
ncbi:hypothetical protein CF394_07600 [Tetzosporium hominis]|uniref:DUF2178 domain-containing protein n=1 Tax=Tetzosporium hominis TaxID=2020506 RepID=A0A264W3D7_9BACL|nr:hypothetical protein [Tetzosporium hominis]OZS78090.1 hypothetical protein CF394_07600 [Tetzosporium hominis]